MTTRLWKYEGLGNDFLVLFDGAGVEATAPLAIALCDRHRGVGADGLLSLAKGNGDVDLAMVLHNADGSLAETSGNGLRCAVLAALHAGMVPTDRPILVGTGAGTARAELLTRGDLGEADIRVTMGVVEVAEEVATPLASHRAFAVSVGNPHLVLYGGPNGAERPVLAELGARIDRSRPDGVNVELVESVEADGTIEIAVWERGVGLTMACGSGSCAVAAALRAAGVVGDEVRVRNPGGVLSVSLSGSPAAPRAALTGPARRVAQVLVEPADLPLVGALRARGEAVGRL